MFPKDYALKVVDMNVEPLTDVHLEWADVALTSTMIVQKDSLYEVAERCNRAGIPIIAGGPHPTSYYDNIKEDFRNLLGLEMDTFKEKVSAFVGVQSDWVNEMRDYSRQLLSRMNKEYDSIHEDFQYAVHGAFADFQSSMSNEYLDAELSAFKATVSTFAKSQTEDFGELQTSIQNLFARVRAQHEQLHDDFKQEVEETFDAFYDAVKWHLEQFFGAVPVQIKGLR